MSEARVADSHPTDASWRIATWSMTAFTAILVPVYLWRYGPTNFLYFCDIALLLALYSLWTRHPLPAGMALVGILLPQLLWTLDLALRICGISLVGMTDYMFTSAIPWPIRALSLFHLWLPILLWWMVRRLGYDRRAYAAWTGLGVCILAISWLLLPAPPAPVDAPALPVNVNLVYGFSDEAPQTWMPGWAWFLMMLVGLPLAVWLPTHALLRRFMRVIRYGAGSVP